MNFMISAGDFLMFYLGLELATIPMASLVAYNTHDSKSSESGLKLIMSAAFSSAVMLFGISLFYGQFGTLYFSELTTVGGVFYIYSNLLGPTRSDSFKSIGLLEPIQYLSYISDQ